MELDELKTIFEDYNLPLNEIANSLAKAAAQLIEEDEKDKQSLIVFLQGMKANYDLLLRIGRLTDFHNEISRQHRSDILDRLMEEMN